MARRARPSALLLIVLAAKYACAQTGGDDTDPKNVQKNVEPSSVSTHGATERIDPHSGNLTLSYTDIHIPGPAGFDINVVRSHDQSKLQRFSALRGVEQWSWPKDGRVLGLGWKIGVAPMVRVSLIALDEPYLKQFEPLCKGTLAKDGSYSLEMPDGSVRPMYYSTSTSSVQTPDGWSLTCPAGAYVLKSPTGVLHAMGDIWENKNVATEFKMDMVLQATRVTDPNGNWFDIEYRNSSYSGRRKDNNRIEWGFGFREPARITSSDGRTVDFIYEDNHQLDTPSHEVTKTFLSRIETPTKTVYYGIGNVGSEGVLTEVNLANQEMWRYEYYPEVVEDPARPVPRLSNWASGFDGLWNYRRVPDISEYGYTSAEGQSNRIKAIVFPTGGRIEYSYTASPLVSVWRSPQGVSCKAQRLEFFEFAPPVINKLFTQNLQVTQKRASDGGVWSYTYALGGSGQFDETTVAGPEGTKLYRFYGSGYFTPAKWSSRPLSDQLDDVGCDPTGGYTKQNIVGDSWKLGLVASESIPALGYSVNYEWTGRKRADLLDYTVTSARVPMVGSLTDGLPTSQGLYLVPVFAADATKRAITMDGASYVTSYSGYTDYGKPTQKVEAGPNGGARTTTLSYFNSAAKSIFGVLKDESFNGGSTVREFDANGNLLSHSVDGVATQYTYDVQGNVATKVAPRGLVHQYSDYKRGIAQLESQPEGIQIQRSVDSAGNVLWEKNAEGKLTSHSYDSLNRITATTFPAGNGKTITYSPNSREAVRGSLVESIEYDQFGRPSSLTLGGIRTEFSNDAAGRRTFESHAGASTGTGYSYDALGRVTGLVNSDGTSQTHTYVSGGKRITDENNNVTSYEYRSYGDPAQKFLVKTMVGGNEATATRFERNARDLVTSVQQGGVTRTYGYNSNYFLTSASEPEIGVTTYGRDAAGNMLSRVVGTSGTTTFAYDGQNRLSSVTYPGNTPAVTNTYNKLHKILTATSSTGTRTNTYDDNGNLIQEVLAVDGITLTASYAYNDNDQLSSVTYPVSGRIVEYSPDALGRPTRASGYVNSIAYWPSGQLRQLVYGNGVVTNYEQNVRLWPSTFSTYKDGGPTHINTSYSYDGKGNLTGISDSSDSSYNRSLGYDSLDRLVSANGPWGSGSITYDMADNITSQTFGAWSLIYGYSSNRLVSMSGNRAAAYTYDSHGNIATGSGNTYTFDGVPNLRCVNCNVAGNAIEYSYDATGKRSMARKGGLTRYEMYDTKGLQLVEFTPVSGNRLVEYVYIGGKRVAQRVSP